MAWSSIVTEQKLKLKLDSDKLKRMVTSTISKQTYNNNASLSRDSRHGYAPHYNRNAHTNPEQSGNDSNSSSAYFMPKNPSAFNNTDGKFKKPYNKPKKPYNNKFGSKDKPRKPFIKHKRFVDPTPPSTFDLHLMALQEKFPKAFVKETRIPLGSNLRHSIAEALSISNKEANLFLFWYCHGSKYLDNFTIGANKVDLDGNIVGQVTIEDIKIKNDAFNILQESIKRKKEKEAAAKLAPESNAAPTETTSA